MEKVNSDYKKFTLGDSIDEEQKAFFDEYGFIHFKNYLSPQGIQDFLASLEKVQSQWIEEKRKKVNGTPIFYGYDHSGKQIVHRFPFTSKFSPEFDQLVKSPSVQSLVGLMDRPSRIGINEKDGVVVNQYINSGQSRMKRLGWHIDGLRDVFMGQKPLPMLNVGVYLTDSRAENGGLRLLPGTHNDKLIKSIFKKPHFISGKPDKNEMAVDAVAGDLTVHHGNIWHRVEPSRFTGGSSRRIVMYVPIVCGKYRPKSENGRTPFYHHFRTLRIK